MKMPSLDLEDPICLICLRYLTPLFPISTTFTIGNDIFSFKDIYVSLTKIELNDTGAKLYEICLLCFRSIVNAFLVIRKSQDDQIASNHCKGISKKASKKYRTTYNGTSLPLIQFHHTEDNGIPSDKDITENKNLNVIQPITQHLEKQAHNAEILRKKKEQTFPCTIVRCRYCETLLFDYEIRSHAKICVNPKKKHLNLIEGKNPALGNGANLPEKKFVGHNTNKLSKRWMKKGKVQKENREKRKLSVNNNQKESQNREPTNELLLLCKLCKKKLFMSEMEEHKKTCSPKIYAERRSSQEVQKNSENIAKKAAVPPQIRTFTCQLCGKQYTDKDEFVAHIVRHGDDYFQCETCSQRFTQRRLLIEHERRHYTQKRLCCPICNKGFNSINNLQSHLVSHRNEV